ncbi:MAG: hypothetical protein WD276_05505 [Actinomycetota bacterium]
MTNPATVSSITSRDYSLLGLRIRSDWPLAGFIPNGPGSPEIELIRAPPSLLAAARDAAGLDRGSDDWFQRTQLPDGSEYLRWTGLFEFLVSADGRQIAGHPLSDVTEASFQAYLLNQVLSFALLRIGAEPIHATAVEVNGQAIAFAADPGVGKSTLAAEFLRDGHLLLTDDLLVVRTEAGSFLVQPSAPRIKLYPEIAESLLGTTAGAVRMNPDTPKLIIDLGPGRASERPAPLLAVYVLRETRGKAGRTTIRRLTRRRAFLELTHNTFNPVPAGRDRLEQQFGLATALAARVPVKSIAYPRDLGALPWVRRRILADLRP